jgi:hypothetical protein
MFQSLQRADPLLSMACQLRVSVHLCFLLTREGCRGVPVPEEPTGEVDQVALRGAAKAYGLTVNIVER